LGIIDNIPKEALAPHHSDDESEPPVKKVDLLLLGSDDETSL